MTGATLGAFFMRYLTQRDFLTVEPISQYDFGPAIMQELLGSQIFIGFFLMQTDKETMNISSERSLNCLIVT